MKVVIRDALILLAICLIAWCLANVRLHSRQIERLRAQVVYTTAVDFDTTKSLMDALEQVGFLNGVPRTYHIDRHDNVIHLQVVAEPGILADKKVEAVLRDAFSKVCRSAFPDNQFTVSLTDTDLTPFHELIRLPQ